MNESTHTTSDATIIRLGWGHQKYPRKYRRTLWKRLHILWLLGRLHRKYPDQRFGQLLMNYVVLYPDNTGLSDGFGCFDTEDWQIIDRLKRVFK